LLQQRTYVLNESRLEPARRRDHRNERPEVRQSTAGLTPHVRSETTSVQKRLNAKPAGKRREEVVEIKDHCGMNAPNVRLYVPRGATMPMTVVFETPEKGARDLEQFDLLFRGQRLRLPTPRRIDPKSGMEVVN